MRKYCVTIISCVDRLTTNFEGNLMPKSCTFGWSNWTTKAIPIIRSLTEWRLYKQDTFLYLLWALCLRCWMGRFRQCFGRNVTLLQYVVAMQSLCWRDTIMPAISLLLQAPKKKLVHLFLHFKVSLTLQNTSRICINCFTMLPLF